MKLEAEEVKFKPNPRERFRLKIDKKLWADAKLKQTVDVTGRRLHLFQLPPDMPVKCLDGVELPVAKKNRWSKAVTVTYTSNEGKDNEQEHRVELKAQRVLGDDTLMQVCDGELIPCDSQPVSLVQGFEVLSDEEICLPLHSTTARQLPEGLRQRFVPIGNATAKETDVSALLASVKTPAQKRKRKAAKVKSEAADSEIDIKPKVKKPKSKKKS